MKYLKTLTLTVLCLVLMSVNSFAGSTPQNVRIGLFYLKSAVNSITVTSDTGFDYGYFSNDTYNSILRDAGTRSITIKKDNSNLSAADSYAYHIGVGTTYDSIGKAKEAAKTITNAGYNAYPVFDGNYKVWVGVYSSSTSANTDIAKLKKAFPSNTYILISPNSKNVQITSSDGKIILLYSLTNSYAQVGPILSNTAPDICGINGVSYRGSVRIIRQGESDMTVINVLSLEKYLYSVVGSEMSTGWPIEALKAQAVAARTFAAKTLLYSSVGQGKYSYLGYDMNNTTEFQAYKGYSKEQADVRRAVDETCGKAAYYNNEPISASYFSSDGGHTENSENVWVSAVPYLKSVEDKYQPAGTTHQNWTNTATPAEIKAYLLSKGVDIGDITDVQVGSYSPAGNALSLKIIGTKGVQEYKKDNIRIFMRGYKNTDGTGDFLLSQTFTVTKPGSSSTNLTAINKYLNKQTINLRNIRLKSKNGTTVYSGTTPIYIKSKNGVKQYSEAQASSAEYTFSGKGWGHGVGMSQYGAKGMAQSGFTYDQILKCFYTGIEIK